MLGQARCDKSMLFLREFLNRKTKYHAQEYFFTTLRFVYQPHIMWLQRDKNCHETRRKIEIFY